MSKPRAQRLAWCGHCDPDSRLVELPDGSAGRCPVCHAAAAKARNDKAQNKARRRERAAGLTDDNCPACGQRIYRHHRCRASSLDPTSVVHPASIREVRIAAGGDL